MDRAEMMFLAACEDGRVSAVPRCCHAVAWAGLAVRHIEYRERERLGNALLARGYLAPGERIQGNAHAMLLTETGRAVLAAAPA